MRSRETPLDAEESPTRAQPNVMFISFTMGSSP
jgi:hypothetical protein